MRKNSSRGRCSRIKQSFFKDNLLVQCCYCDEPLTYQQATIEHIVKIAEGGKSNRDNVTIACEPCNHHRGDYSFEEWRRLVQERYEDTRERGIVKFTNHYNLIYRYLKNNNRLIERKYLR